jgi:hypothetical protein
MNVPDDLSLRPGNNRHYVKIYTNGKEIGHLRIDSDGRVLGSWAIFIEDKHAIRLVSTLFDSAAMILNDAARVSPA